MTNYALYDLLNTGTSNDYLFLYLKLVLLPGKSHGRRSLVGCSPCGRWGPDTTERLHFHFSLSCIGEGNGNPFLCSCLENPRKGEPGGLPSMGSHRVRHDWSNLAAAAAADYTVNYTVNWTENYTVHGIFQARTLEWVAFPVSRGSSQLRDQTQVSRLAGRFCTSWATREAPWATREALMTILVHIKCLDGSQHTGTAPQLFVTISLNSHSNPMMWILWSIYLTGQDEECRVYLTYLTSLSS